MKQPNKSFLKFLILGALSQATLALAADHIGVEADLEDVGTGDAIIITTKTPTASEYATNMGLKLSAASGLFSLGSFATNTENASAIGSRTVISADTSAGYVAPGVSSLSLMTMTNLYCDGSNNLYGDIVIAPGLTLPSGQYIQAITSTNSILANSGDYVEVPGNTTTNLTATNWATGLYCYSPGYNNFQIAFVSPGGEVGIVEKSSDWMYIPNRPKN